MSAGGGVVGVFAMRRGGCRCRTFPSLWRKRLPRSTTCPPRTRSTRAISPPRSVTCSTPSSARQVRPAWTGCDSSPTSCDGSTGYHWPSNWPPDGCPRSPSPTSPSGWTARSTCSAPARPHPNPGTGRCARPSSGPTNSSPPTSGGCSGTCRSSPMESTSPRPKGSPPRLGLAGDPGSALAHLVEASMIDATFDGSDPLPHARDDPGVRARPAGRGRRRRRRGSAIPALGSRAGRLDRLRPDDRARTGGRRRPSSGAAQPAVRVAPGSPAATPGRRRRVGARPVGGLRVARPHRALGLDRGAGQRPVTSRPPPRRRRAGVRGKRRIHARGLHPGRTPRAGRTASGQPTPGGRCAV